MEQLKTFWKKLDGINNVMQEDVAGARVVKAYVREDYEITKFEKAADNVYKLFVNNMNLKKGEAKNAKKNRS